MKCSITGQEIGDLLIEVTVRAGLTVYIFWYTLQCATTL